MEFLELVFWNNSLLRWGIALGIVLLTLLVFQVLKGVVFRNIRKLVQRTNVRADDAIGVALARTNRFLVLILALYLGSQALQLPPAARPWIETIAVIALIAQIAFWIDAVIVFLISDYHSKALETNAAQVTTVRALGYVARVIVLSLLLLLALDNIPGVEITPLLASLGVAGIAVSLALQSSLADLIASLVIALDKPFVLNDFIIVGDFMGTVEKIGVKTTRLRSLGGEQLIFPNSDIVSSRIRNYKRMEERRIVFGLGVVYNTSYDTLRQIPGIIRGIIEAQEQARFDRAHFASYGDYALNFEIVYYVLSADYNLYMDVQQAINLDIFQAFEQAGIEFAYPTQVLYLSRPQNGDTPPVAGAPAPPDQRDQPRHPHSRHGDHEQRDDD